MTATQTNLIPTKVKQIKQKNRNDPARPCHPWGETANLGCTGPAFYNLIPLYPNTPLIPAPQLIRNPRCNLKPKTKLIPQHESIAGSLYCLWGHAHHSTLRRRMLTFTPPRWQPLGLRPQIPTRTSDSCSRPTQTIVSCLAHPTRTTSASVPTPLHDPPAHDVQHRTRGHVRPRAVEALGASIRDNAPPAPGAFDPARGWEGEATRDKVQLVLSLKAMGRRFEWRGALKVFRRAKEDGVMVDNSVYRSVTSELGGGLCSVVLRLTCCLLGPYVSFLMFSVLVFFDEITGAKRPT